MCGIGGILNLDGAPVEAVRLHRMAALLVHRGPDGQGFAAFPADHTVPALLWQDPARAPAPDRLEDSAIGFVHRRRAVLDPAETEHQPTASADGRYWGVMDGRIYNHSDLRTALGVPFRGRSDTEVLLAAWSAWGERCLERLEGMFAFAVWDRPGNRLFLARDRFGIKPLYYAEADGRIGFASGIKPVLAGLDLPVRPRSQAACDFLVRGLKDHRATTFFDGILQVPPGHLVAVKARASAPRAWYDVSTAVLSRGPACVQDFRAAFEASVSSHLGSGAPVGICLSGSLESSAILGLAERLRKGGIHTFPAPKADPIREAGGFLDVLPDLLWHQEGPVASASPYVRWLLAQEAAACGVKVILDGRGADEILAGHPGMHRAAVADALRELRLFWALGTWWRFASPSPEEGNPSLFLSPDLLAAGEEEAAGASVGNRFLTERLKRIRRHLPSLLHDEDRSDMAHGVETGVPFLERAVVETALALPASALLEGGLTKVALRKACADVLPEAVRLRRDDVTADQTWLQQGGGRRLDGMLAALEQAGSGWIDWTSVRREVAAGRIPRHLTALLTTDLWRAQAASPDYLKPRPGA